MFQCQNLSHKAILIESCKDGTLQVRILKKTVLPLKKSKSEQGQGGHMARAVMKPWLQFAVQAVRSPVS